MTHLEAYIEAINNNYDMKGKFIIRSYSKRMSGFGMDFSLIRELYYVKDGIVTKLLTIEKREFMKNVDDGKEYENEMMDIHSISEIDNFLKQWKDQ